MLDPTIAAFLESGCGLVVGVVAPDGSPVVGRAWGITVVDPDAPVVRFFVPADDARLAYGLVRGAEVAITAASVRTYHSIQLKGSSLGVEAVDDETRVRRYIDEFFTDLVEVNAMPREQCERFVPRRFTACTLAVRAMFDQTPGPGAGAAVPSSSP